MAASSSGRAMRSSSRPWSTTRTSCPGRYCASRSAQDCADLLAQYLPGHDVRVVLHGRDDDLIARPEELAAIGLGHQVDALGGAADEDPLARIGSVEELLDPGAGSLEVARGPLTQQVNAAVDVGVVGLVVAAQRLQDGARLLRGGGVVQVDQGLAVDLLLQDREVCADAVHVEHGV